MKYSLLFLVLFCFQTLAEGPVHEWKAGDPVSTIAMEPDPFWKKPKVWERIIRPEERAILISVVKRPFQGKKYPWEYYLQGVGVLNVPTEFAFSQMRKFEQLPHLSGFITSADYSPQTGLLSMSLKFIIWFQTKLKLRIEFREPSHFSFASLPGTREIAFLAVEGDLVGLNGVVRFKDLGRRTTEISMTAQRGFDRIPALSNAAIKLGLIETALQIMARKLRSFIENSWKNQMKE
ncbi:MAG: hypothetical protein K1X29_06275 [Bdellovibrionales bacterium]|nr:hypothetical protein [Bdellovibrionales bacterium]